MKAFLLALALAGCGESHDGSDDASNTPHTLTCADVVRGFAAELQGQVDGRVVVRVRNPWSITAAGQDPAPVAGAVVRVENGSLRIEATTDSSGCVEIDDPALTSAYAVHVFGIDGKVRSILGDNRRIQEISLPQGLPPDVQPSLATVNASLRGLETIPQTSVDFTARYVTVFPGNTFWAPPLEERPANFYGVFADTSEISLEVEPGPAQPIVAIGGEIDIEFDRISRVTTARIGVAEARQTTAGETVEVEIDMSHPIDVPMQVEISPPPNGTGYVSVRPSIRLPGQSQYILLQNTNVPWDDRTAAIVVPALAGPLAGATLTVGMGSSWSIGEHFVSTGVSAERRGTADVVFPSWLAISSDLEKDGRRIRVPVSDVTRCEFDSFRGSTSWRAVSFSAPWEFEYPEPPAGFGDAYVEDATSIRITCARIPAGNKYDRDDYGDAVVAFSW